MLFCALSVAACGAASEDAEDPAPTRVKPGQLRVLSYNVNFGLAGDGATLAMIRAADADLVLLQETNPDWAQALRAEFAGDYAHMDFRHCCRAGGLAILAKFPVTHAEYIPAPSGWFPAWRVMAHTPLGDIQVLDVHLHPPVTDSGSWVLGQFTTSGIRLTEIKEYVKHLDPGLPTVIAGDFNEGQTGSSLQFLEERGFRNGSAAHQPNAPTWRWQTKLGMVRAQLDHVLHGPGLHAHSARILQGGSSDHLPVLVVLRGSG